MELKVNMYIEQDKYHIVFVGTNKEKIKFIENKIKSKYKTKTIDFSKLEKFNRKTFYDLLVGEGSSSSGVENRQRILNNEVEAVIIKNAENIKHFRKNTKAEIISLINSLKRKKKFFLFANNEQIVKEIRRVPNNYYFAFLKVV